MKCIQTVYILYQQQHSLEFGYAHCGKNLERQLRKSSLARAQIHLLTGVNGELRLLRNAINSSMILLRFMKQEVLRPVWLSLFGVIMLTVAITIFTGKQVVESATDVFITKAEADDSHCIKESDIAELESIDVSYAYCFSINNEPSVFFIASGGTQTDILQNNNLGASVMFSRGVSQDVIGLIGVPNSLSSYDALRSLVRVDDQIEYDPQGIGKKFMGLASWKGSVPEGLTWKLPADFSGCSRESRCLGLQFDAEIFSDVACDSFLEVDLMWLNWANKVEGVTTAKFSVGNDEKRAIQIRADSPKQRALQVLQVRCDS